MAEDAKGKGATAAPRIALTSVAANGLAVEESPPPLDELKTPTLPPSPSLYRPAEDYVDPLIALAPTPANLSALALSASASLSRVSEAKTREIFTKAYLRAASSGDADLLEWLLAKPPLANRFTALPPRSSPRPDTTPRGEGTSTLMPERLLRPGEARRWIDLDAKDDDGTPAIVLAAAFGHTESVRAILDGCGESVVEQRDAAGWTPLHWASRNDDFTIVSYLLNHGASASIVSFSGSQEGLSMLARSASSSTLASDFSTESRRARGLRPYDLAGRGRDGDSVRHIISMVDSPASRAGASKRGSLVKRLSADSQRRLDRALQACRALELDFTRLRLGPDPPQPDLSSDEDDAEEPFDWDECQPGDMLIFSPGDLPAFFDAFISDLDPVRPRSARSVAANAVFFGARFAAKLGPEGLLDDLLLGAFDRIEEALHERADDVANCAFWLFNTLALLSFLKRDATLAPVTTEHQLHLHDLINEAFVYVIREAERRIDKVLDGALLDYTSLPGFEELSFEGEGWSLVKALTGRRSRQTSSRFSLTSAFDPPSSPPRSPSTSPSASPDPNVGRTMSNVGTFPSEDQSPRSVTSLLSATLFVLESYEIHPCVVVQAFSQVFYWMACEMFNRVLTRRKYLSRSKAMQIRVNVTAIEDWTRTNRLPIATFEQPFRPLNQLLQWLQCMSGEQALDGLISTMHNLAALNPLQMLKASREYRFEVSESRMGEECRQYLVQMHQDWERRRADEAEHHDPGQDPVVAVDRACKDAASFRTFQPPLPSEPTGELLDPRQMLPFALPSATETLVDLSAAHVLGLVPPADSKETPPNDTLVPAIPSQFLDAFDVARQRHSLNTGLGLGLG